MKAAAIRSILIATSLLLGATVSSVFSQIDQTIWYQYCVAQPDTNCFEPQEGAVDSVGRDVGALGGSFRICLQLDTIDSGFAPLRVMLVLDNSGSMCNHYGPNNCCVPGDGSGECSRNDPFNKRVEAAKLFVDSLRVINPLSEVGVIVYSTSISGSVLRPTPLTNDNNVASIHSAIERAGCAIQDTTGGTGGGLTKTGRTMETNLGLGLERALTEIDRNFDDMPDFMTRHIILLTDGAWDDVEIRSPDALINAYQAANPERSVPKVHGVFLSDSATHVMHGYPPEGCAETQLVDLSYLAYVAAMTNGLYFGGSTPQTVVANFKTLLDSVTQTAAQMLDSLIVTNTTNGETRTNATARQIGDSPTWEATLRDLPVEFGPNVLKVRRVILKPNGEILDLTTTVTVIRSDRYREAIDIGLFKEYCELVQANIRIAVSPDTQKQGQPFDVAVEISEASNFTLDTVQARLFTRFPDNEPGVLATFHLDGNLDNASGGEDGLGTPDFTPTSMLYGSGAIVSGSFTYSLPQLADAFVIEEWVKPGNNSAAVLFSGGGIEIGVTAGMKLYLKSGGTIIDTAVVPLDDGVWSHIGVARANGKVTLFINGVAVTNPVDFTAPITGGAMTISVPQRWVVDEVRFSNTNRMTNDGATQVLVIPTVTNAGWSVQGNASSGFMVKIPPSAWTDSGTSLDFTFTSPVAGRVLVNIRQKETGDVGTGWSKNGNPVFVAADLEPPYVKQAVLTPGPMEGSESRDRLRIIFNEAVNCEILMEESDPSRTFMISRGRRDMEELLEGSRYDTSTIDCEKNKYITEVTLLVHTGIAPATDSIRIISEAAVDSAGNVSPVENGKKGDVVWGPGAFTEVIPVKSDSGDPMEIDQRIKRELGIREQKGKVIGINTLRPFDTVKVKGEIAFGTAMIYDAVGNLVEYDLPVQRSASSDRLYYVVWDGTNRHGRRVGRGSYLIRFAFKQEGVQGVDRKKFSITWK
ncbi:MAG: VWA domain-containing protein [Chitinispirillaceae bacterium]|nr:VWA domain-containing protein [Chitinispirillaceae bacterium]